jgi:hypothetical protein
MNISSDPRAWIGAIMILCIYSFLWKENLVFRLAEHIYIGAGAGHALSVGFNTIKTTAWIPFTKGTFILIIPLVLGALLYTRFVKRWAWISRLCLAIPVGLGIGLSLRSLPAAQITSQIKISMLPLTTFDNIVIVVGVVGTLVFFFFTTKPNPVTRTLATAGKWTMMITFGLTFATSVFGQMAIYMGALERVMGNWLGLIK